MQYTIRNIPSDLDAALRERAAREGKSLARVTIEVLRGGLGLAAQPLEHRDLSDVVGTWVDDAETDAALDAQRVVDPEAWQ